MSLESQSREFTHQAQQTRARVRQAAIQLFNKAPTSDITTHQIAEAAGMSPGNLYYHYPNKEAVIRDIFYEMDIYSTRSWVNRGPENSEEGFTDFMRFFFGNLEKYRFFFRDFSTLIRNDTVLKKMWREYTDNLRSTLERAALLWIEKGYIKKFSHKKELDAFIENSWILAHFTFGYIESTTTKNVKQAFEHSLELFIQFLYPYHTEKGQRVLRLYLN